jgi:hypothetical protein
MTWQQIPNVRVWSQGRDYVEASEILLDYNRIHPAAVVASLAIEIFVKSFLATRLATGHATTDFGHDIVTLYERITPEIRVDLLACSAEVDAAVSLVEQLKRHDGIFKAARYFYEPTAPFSVGSDTVHFARHPCEVVFLLGKKRGV